ncbi:hypothetical protein [Haloarcula laminariae]|uniref:hypothetical protein n=1 Tax=Haloarcula laminariae TaxID=2961577 RepID=UPI002406E1C7|nr:hypothetical protein [Halomicroarcula sp. FL173]
MAEFELTIFDGPERICERFEADPSSVTINSSGEGAKITAGKPGADFFQAFVPTGFPYSLEETGD